MKVHWFFNKVAKQFDCHPRWSGDIYEFENSVGTKDRAYKAEDVGRLFEHEAYPPDVKEQARALMALLGSLRVDAAATFVRAHVEAGNKYDGYKRWCDLKNRFTLRQALTIVGLFDRIMAWPTNETICPNRTTKVGISDPEV